MNQTGGSRTDTLVKLVLILFISLLAFSIGTVVGKSVTENQYRETRDEPTQDDSVETASNEEEADDEAVDDEALNLTDEFAKIKNKEHSQGREVASEGHTEAPANKPHAATGPAAPPSPSTGHIEAKAPTHSGKSPSAHHAEAAKVGAHGGTESSSHDNHGTAPSSSHDGHGNLAASKGHDGKDLEAAHRIAIGKAPTEAPKPTVPKADHLPKEVGSNVTGKYTIQIASYAKEEEANKHSADLIAKGFSAFVVPAKVKGQTWYRVSVGQFTSQAEAIGYKEDFIKKSNISKVIIQKIAP